MASLRRIPGSRYWIACFQGPDGSRVQRSTKMTDRRKAWKVALEWEEASRQAGQGRLLQAQARRVLNDILRQAGQDPIEEESAALYFNRWLKGKGLKKSEGTITRYAHSVRLFIESLGTRAGRALEHLTALDVERFRDGELRKGKAQSTVSVDLKTIRTAFNAARRQGIISTNPVDAVDLPSDERHSREPFSTEQLRRLLDAAPVDWKTAVMIGYYIGARLGDVAGMTWSNVDLGARVFRYKQEKTGKAVECPIHPDLEAYLMGMAGDDPNAPLCPSLVGVTTGGTTGLSRQFKEIMAKAGVDDGRIDPAKAGGRGFSRWSFHSLRYSFNSGLANQGVEVEIRQALSGHSKADQNRRYTVRQMSVFRDAIGKLPKIRA